MQPFSAGSMNPPRFLNIISTKRSGHHAFIRWIEAGSRAPTRFINNAAPTETLIGSMTRLAQGMPEAGTIILNYEGVSIAGVSKVIGAQEATGADVCNVLFVRDPLNACASLLHRKALRYAELVMILRQLFALRNWLRLYQAGNFNGNIAFYNQWLVSREYRASLADKLSISSTPPPDEITSFGGGSSFKDISTGGEGAASRLLHRWKKYQDDSLFRALITHPHFFQTFMDEVSGAIRDENGLSDDDAERAAFLEEAHKKRPRHSMVDRIIDGMVANEKVYEQIEARPPGLQKRLIIAGAHLRALLPRRMGLLGSRP